MIDIFALCDRVVAEYRDYVRSFVHVRDPRLRTFVDREIDGGRLWPDAVLQLNPAYRRGARLRDLAREGVITEETARFFGPDLHLYVHQERAIRLACAGRSCLVTTGTGSGKSLAYLVPMVDAAFRRGIDGPGVVGLCIYPMNALIGSQRHALEEFRRRNWPDCPLTFERYTGEDRSTEHRNRLLASPPHILLTNYVMLEFILLRPSDRTIAERITERLRLLAVDELHVYRGRQGADVAMLLRRLRERVGREDLVMVGTSATVAGGPGEDRRHVVAEVGRRLFGVPFAPRQVVEEELERRCTVEPPRTPEELRRALGTPLPDAPDPAALAAHPLIAWIEARFGVVEEGGRRRRPRPQAFTEAVKEVADRSGVGEGVCRERLTRALELACRAEVDAGIPFFAFRLHQFLASGTSIHATLEDARTRACTVEPGRDADGRTWFPLAFCRECGQEFYLVSRVENGSGLRFHPRPPVLDMPETELDGEPGYLVVDDGGLWNADEDGWPDHWLDGNGRVKKDYRPHIPERLHVRADGSTANDGLEVVYQPRPLMICPRCRTSWDLRVRKEYGKLTTFGRTGRSTATTVEAAAVLRGLADQRADPAERKLLSFTDNRQDAALQAGHTNDFVLTVLVRAALVGALRERRRLRTSELGPALFDALSLPPQRWMREPVESGPGFERARGAMVEVLTYLGLLDLARSWRVTQPNLEDCGLLRIDYEGLADLARDDAHWREVPLFADVDAARRERLLRAFLDHLRRSLALDAPALDSERMRRMRERSVALLCDPWRLDEGDPVEEPTIALLPGFRPRARRRMLSLGSRSLVGRWLRRELADVAGGRPSLDDTDALVLALVEALRGHFLVTVNDRGNTIGVRLSGEALLWLPGDGRAPPPDPIRARAVDLRVEEELRREPNRYFTRLYTSDPRWLAGLHAAEHTGQVDSERRREREEAFREGRLSLLCCSPTMELGIDIRTLVAVHMRNVPPDPARYAQRGGRAGRGGQPALVLAFASEGSPHDRHFFEHRDEMIAGDVRPPVFDPSNRDVLQAHLQSLWLASTGIDLGSSVAGVLDLSQPEFPLADHVREQIQASRLGAERLQESFRRIAQSVLGRELDERDEIWIDDILHRAPERFDRAFDRWRQLYRAALKARDAARAVIDQPHVDRKKRQEAEHREREAKQELAMLRNERGGLLSEFYPYRYLASEGFIPGYNFPRLPVRVYVPTERDTETVERPRFLGLAEFGPGNLLYHEGRQYRIAACRLPADGLHREIARRCPRCGCLHCDSHVDDAFCRHCETSLEGAESWANLLEQPPMRAQRTARISCEEEERAREGFDIVTAFEPAGPIEPWVDLADADGPILRFRRLESAWLWRINRRWKRGRDRSGFPLDPETGRWGRLQQPGEVEAGEHETVRVVPFVRDRRHLAFVEVPVSGEHAGDALVTFAYALARALERCFALEEGELAVELVGEGDARMVLVWEAAEGALGVVGRLGEVAVWRRVADEALRLLHVDPRAGRNVDGACESACYRCLLAYSNQPGHPRLDRRLVMPLFLRLREARAVEPNAESREAHWRRLRDLVDSGFERHVLDRIYERGLPLPDHAQFCPADDVAVQVDFYWAREGAPGMCLFVDGPHHDDPARRRRDLEQREALEDRGFAVGVIRFDEDLDAALERLARTLETFGIGRRNA